MLHVFEYERLSDGSIGCRVWVMRSLVSLWVLTHLGLLYMSEGSCGTYALNLAQHCGNILIRLLESLQREDPVMPVEMNLLPFKHGGGTHISGGDDIIISASGLGL